MLCRLSSTSLPIVRKYPIKHSDAMIVHHFKIKRCGFKNSSPDVDVKQAASVGLDLGIHRCQTRLTGGLSIVPLSRFVQRMPAPTPVSKDLAQPAQRSRWPKETGLWVFQSSIFRHHPRNCESGGLSEICGWFYEYLSHDGRVFQSTSFGEWNLLEVGFSHQEFLMN